MGSTMQSIATIRNCAAAQDGAFTLAQDGAGSSGQDGRERLHRTGRGCAELDFDDCGSTWPSLPPPADVQRGDAAEDIDAKGWVS